MAKVEQERLPAVAGIIVFGNPFVSPVRDDA